MPKTIGFLNRLGKTKPPLVPQASGGLSSFVLHMFDTLCCVFFRADNLSQLRRIVKRHKTDFFRELVKYLINRRCAKFFRAGQGFFLCRGHRRQKLLLPQSTPVQSVAVPHRGGLVDLTSLPSYTSH